MTLQICEYSPEWADLYHNEEKRLQGILAPIAPIFYQIGSTSVPGLAAKPTIDILGVVDNILQVDLYIQHLNAFGYSARNEFGMPRRRFFQHPQFNLHIFEEGNPQIARHILFRDYLRAHPEACHRYAALKYSLIKENPMDREGYCNNKTPLIKEIDILAIQWWNKPLPHSLPPTPLHENAEVEQINSALAHNVYLQMTYFSYYVPKWDLHCISQTTILHSPIDSDTFNYILNTRFSPHSALLEANEVISFLREQNKTFSWWVCPLDLPSHLSDILIELGLEFKELQVGMYRSITDHKAPAKPKELQIGRVLSTEDMHLFDQVLTNSGGNSDAYHYIYSKIPPILYAEGAPIELYIGSVEGKPVVTAMITFYAGIAGIYYLVTTPEERHKGYATAMVHALLQRAQAKDYQIAALGASFSGKRLYEKLGFKECCRFEEYALATS